MTKTLMLTPGAGADADAGAEALAAGSAILDSAMLDRVAELIAAAVARQEALALVAPLTAADYRLHLDGLMALAAAGDAGLGVALSTSGDLLGTAQWMRSSYRTRRVLAELDRVCVVPTARGLGVGRMLVDLLATDAMEHGIEVLGLEVRGNNHAAIALYEGAGFQRTGLIPNAAAVDEDRYDIVLMHRELGRPAGVRLIGSDPTGAGSSTLR